MLRAPPPARGRIWERLGGCSSFRKESCPRARVHTEHHPHDTDRFITMPAKCWWQGRSMQCSSTSRPPQSVSPLQRGFVKGRQILDNVFDREAAVERVLHTFGSDLGVFLVVWISSVILEPFQDLPPPPPPTMTNNNSPPPPYCPPQGGGGNAETCPRRGQLGRASTVHVFAD